MQKTFDEIVLFARTGLNPRQNFKLGQGNNKYITIKNIKNNALFIDDNTDVIDDDAIKMIHKRSQIKKGDILFASIGRMGDMYIIESEPKGWDINESIFAFTLDTSIIRQKYFYYLFRVKSILNYLDSNSSGSTFKSIKMNQLKKMVFDIPSLDEQDTIINVLDRISCVIELKKQELDKLDELVKARFVELFGYPEYNDMCWMEKPLGELCKVGSSKRIYQNELCQQGVPFLKISDLVSKMDKRTCGYSFFIPEEKYNELIEQELVPSVGDILLTARGTLGRCYIITGEDKFYFQDGMITWLSNFDKSIRPQYLTYLFDMNGVKKQIDELQAGSTVAYLSIAMTKSLKVMVPPIELQNQFADFVHKIDKSKFVVAKMIDIAQSII